MESVNPALFIFQFDAIAVVKVLRYEDKTDIYYCTAIWPLDQPDHTLDFAAMWLEKEDLRVEHVKTGLYKTLIWNEFGPEIPF